MEVADVGAPGGKKVTRSLLRKANSFAYILIDLHVCPDNVIFHVIKEGRSLEIACVEHVVCTCTR